MKKVVARTSPLSGANWPMTTAIDLKAEGEGENGERFCFLKVRARGRSRMELIRTDDLTLKSPIFQTLNQRGAQLISNRARNELIERIQAYATKVAIRKVATCIGFRGNEFVLPDKVYSSGKAHVAVALDTDVAAYAGKYRVSKSQDGSIFELAVGNSRLLLVLALAFVGPCVRLDPHLESVACQLCGPAGSAKTTFATAAGSVWGCYPDAERAARPSFAEAWNNTPNQFEILARAHNNTLLIADETRVTTGGFGNQAKAIADIVMRLEGGTERGRLNEATPRHWWTPFLSTSNHSLDEIFRLGGIPIDDAYRGRLIDIPPPETGYGMIENLHGSSSVAEFSARLHALATESFGWSARAFVTKLVGACAINEPAVATWFAARRSSFLARAPKGTEPRVAQKFATLYAAARLAARFKVVHWSRKEIGSALLSCLVDHTRHVAGTMPTTAAAVRSPIAILIEYLRTNRHRFVDLRVPGFVVPDEWQSREYVKASPAGPEFLIAGKAFDKIVGSKASAGALKADLVAKGLLDATGAHGNRFETRRRIGHDRRHVLAVSEKILDQPSA